MKCVALDTIVLNCIPGPVAKPHQTFDAEDDAENTRVRDLKVYFLNLYFSVLTVRSGSRSTS